MDHVAFCGDMPGWGQRQLFSTADRPVPRPALPEGPAWSNALRLWSGWSKHNGANAHGCPAGQSTRIAAVISPGARTKVSVHNASCTMPWLDPRGHLVAELAVGMARRAQNDSA